MTNSVNFLNDPFITATGHGPDELNPIAYTIDANLSFLSGVYEQNGVSIPYIDTNKVTIQLNVSEVSAGGSSNINFRDDFSSTCLQHLDIDIVVHDGNDQLGKTGGTHQEDCEEVTKPLKKNN